jgi:ATP-dependent DNA helicase
MYHGTPAERADLRRTVMRLPETSDGISMPEEEVTRKKRAGRKAKGKKAPARKPPAPKRKAKGRPAKRRKIESDDEDSFQLDEDTSDVDDTHIPTPHNNLSPQTPATFPVVVTTYEMILKDRVHLSAYDWGYIVVDEGHRLKNLNCKLMQEIKKYPSAGRMILTGTPLHVRFFPVWAVSQMLTIYRII